MPTIRDKQRQKDDGCYRKAKDNGEMTFTLVEHDMSTPKTILFWIMENLDNASDFKLTDAFELALSIKRSQTVLKRKAD